MQTNKKSIIIYVYTHLIHLYAVTCVEGVKFLSWDVKYYIKLKMINAKNTDSTSFDLYINR